MGVFLAAIVSPAALCLAVIRGEISERLLRFTLLAFAVATAALVVILASIIAWGSVCLPLILNCSWETTAF